MGVERPGREADHSPLYSAEAKNAWSFTSPPKYASTVWCSVRSENFSCHFTIYEGKSKSNGLLQKKKKKSSLTVNIHT
jgi:hypothetical protein